MSSRYEFNGLPVWTSLGLSIVKKRYIVYHLVHIHVGYIISLKLQLEKKIELYEKTALLWQMHDKLGY